MRIAMIGQKGIPALHGGPERHVEELAVRMAQRGHEVLVYTRPNYSDPRRRSYRGVELRSLPSIGTKHLDAITHVTLCSGHALTAGVDVVHYQAEGAALLAWLPRLARKPTVVTVHGRDWQREKWGRLASGVLHAAEWMSLRVPQATISVSESMAEELEAAYERPVVFIPNGVSISSERDETILDELGVRPGRYVLFAARLVPEKGCHYLIDAWTRGGFDGFRLVVAGGSSFTDDYVDGLRRRAGDEAVFAGWVHGARLASLFAAAALYVLPSDLEGLPIVLLEALAYGTPVLASDLPANREVLGRFGATFRRGSVDDLHRQLVACLDDLPGLREAAGEARETITAQFDWEAVTDRTLAVYEEVVGRRLPARHAGDV